MPKQVIVEGATTIRSLDPGSIRGVDAGRILKIRYFGRPLHKIIASYLRLSYGLQGLMHMEEFYATVADQADAPKITI